MLNKEGLISQAKDNARQNFREGANCAESVVKAVYDTGIINDFPSEIIALSPGFGGGIGQYGTICGALAGATIAVGCVHGRQNPLNGTFEERVSQLQGSQGLYRLFNNLPKNFVEKFGSCDCSLLTIDYKDNLGARERKRQCLQYVIESAGMAIECIINGNEEGYTKR